MSASPSPRPPSATSGLPWRSTGLGADPSPPAASVPPHKSPVGPRPRQEAFWPVLVLYVATLAIDALRKLTGLPGATLGIIYVLVGLTYIVLLLRHPRIGPAPRSLPVWLALLSVWCAAEAVVQRVPVGMALLGWVSYVFMVPLFYVGAKLMADDHRAARALRIVAVAGGMLGLGAVVSARLGQSSPALLQPIMPSAGIHSFSGGNIYLAPSVFATAEEVSEQLLIALFAWAALAKLPAGRLGRVFSAVVGVLIVTGLFAAARRADIIVAVAGIAGLTFLGLADRPRRAGRVTARARGRLWPALLLAAAGSAALLFLGAGKLVPFLTSGSAGSSALAFMFSPTYPGSLTGQGPGTSTQGAALIGATSFTSVNSQGPHTVYVLGGRSFLTAEGGLTKTWIELGIVGGILYGGVFLSVLGPAIRRLGRQDAIGRTLTVLTIALGVIFLKGHQSLDNPLVQPLFWLAAGGAWGRMRARSDAGQPADRRARHQARPPAAPVTGPALRAPAT